MTFYDVFQLCNENKFFSVNLFGSCVPGWKDPVSMFIWKARTQGKRWVRCILMEEVTAYKDTNIQ